MSTTHWQHSDARFCGTNEAPRRFSPFAEEITCPDCRGDNDTLTLSVQGRDHLLIMDLQMALYDLKAAVGTYAERPLHPAILKAYDAACDALNKAGERRT